MLFRPMQNVVRPLLGRSGQLRKPIAASRGFAAAPLPIRTQHFINNEFVDSIEKSTFDTFNPATEEKIATVQAAGVADVDKAVRAAEAAMTSWRDVSGPDRRDMMLKLADLMEENKQRLAEVESLDNGKPISIAGMWIFSMQFNTSVTSQAGPTRECRVKRSLLKTPTCSR